jgi:hypothetical protein
MVKLQTAISSWVTGMLGFLMHWKRSSGAPCFLSASRMMRTASKVVPLLRGCGEKITASFAFSA